MFTLSIIFKKVLLLFGIFIWKKEIEFHILFFIFFQSDKNELKLLLQNITLCLKTVTDRKNPMLLYFKREINDEEKYKKF